MGIAHLLVLVASLRGETGPLLVLLPAEVPVERRLPPVHVPRDADPGEHEGHEHAHASHGPPTAHGSRFRHLHASRRGTPQVHGFLTEPAFLGRDVILGFSRLSGPGSVETEVEAEVEWAVSRRVLLVGEVAHAWEPEEDAWSPVEVGVRYLVAETDRVLLSVQGNVAIPTASGQATPLGASLLGWGDLGADVTLQASLGVERDLDADTWAVPFAATLAWSTPLRSPFVRCGVDEHAHGIETRLTLLAEIGGELPLDDDEESEATAFGLVGFALPLTHEVEVRAGWLRGLSGDAEDVDGLTLGLIVHL
jgi:hypothetical protein